MVCFELEFWFPRQRREPSAEIWGHIYCKGRARSSVRSVSRRQGGVMAIGPSTPRPGPIKDGGVKFFLRAVCHQPDSIKTSDAPFYLNVNYQKRAGAIVWYKARAMGHNNICLILKMAGIRAGIPQHLTNHCVRKTSVERLLNFRINPTIVAQHSGHKNVAGINNYAEASSTFRSGWRRLCPAVTCLSRSRQ